MQALAAIGANAYLPAWFTGDIVTASSKGVCVPMLNCYSCPSAIGACPVGSLQYALGTLRRNVSQAQYQLGLYVVGFLGVVGGLGGRVICGWACPFGLLQEGMYRIPSRKFRIPHFLSYLRYVMLAVFVILLPTLVLDQFGYGDQWFCSWICPAGTLEAGIPLLALNPDLRGLAGLLFAWKVFVLVVFLVLMVFTMRPFCRTTCPLGAILGFFNRVSMFQLKVNHTTCASCGTCEEACPIDIKVLETPNSADCIRCLKCVNACPNHSLRYEFLGRRSGEAEAERAARRVTA